MNMLKTTPNIMHFMKGRCNCLGKAPITMCPWVCLGTQHGQAWLGAHLTQDRLPDWLAMPAARYAHRMGNAQVRRSS